MVLVNVICCEVDMKLVEAISEIGEESAVAMAKIYAIGNQVNWDDEAQYVFAAVARDKSRVPGNIGGKNDTAESAIQKWVLKYRKGLDGRASNRVSNPPGTKPDPIIETIISSRLNVISQETLEKIILGHRLAMSAENILGVILEEYLSVNLKDSGWHCAWGETVKSVDFVNENGMLLQIKNRSNSENSSSSSVREGTSIKKWYRINATTGAFFWSKLNQICNI
ncbi:SinI family restriction endonuclease, partial [bacterium]|nr:SinI family restriction endonuclease [bacterium]